MRSNPNPLLIKIVIGLFYSRFLDTPNTKFLESIPAICEKARDRKKPEGDMSEGEVTGGILQTIEWLMDLPPDIQVDGKDISSTLLAYCGFESGYVDVIKDTLPTAFEIKEVTPEFARNRVSVVVSELEYSDCQDRLAELVAKANRRINFLKEDVNATVFVEELKAELDKAATVSKIGQEKKGFAGRVNTSVKGQLEYVLSKANEMRSTAGRMVTPLKGINDMWGGGHIRGECICYGGLTHNYKTGISVDYSWWLPMFNKPFMIDPNKKPLIIRFSFENQVSQDIPQLYRVIWENVNKRKLPKDTIIDPTEAENFIVDQLGRNGYTVILECYDPNNMDIWDVIDILEKYQTDGYEIHAAILDYMELLTRNNKRDRQDQAINNAFETFRNYCFARSILNVHGHQLSTEAQKIARESPIGFTKRVARGSYWMNSQSLSTKFDGEAIMHIVNDKYLSFSRGKHRGGEDTPIKYRNFYYEFQDFGNLGIDLDNPRPIYSFSEISGVGGGIGGMGGGGGDDDW